MPRFPVWSKLASTTAAILILAAGCSEPAPTAVQLEPSATSAARGGKANIVKAGKPFAAGEYSQVIGPSGGTLAFGIGTLDFPRGAVNQPIRITAKTDGESFTVDFGPDGTVFNSGAEPTLTFDLGGYSSGNLETGQIFYVDAAGIIIEAVTTFTDNGDQKVSGLVRHFSAYAYATP